TVDRLVLYLIESPARLSHLALKLLDLNQVLWIERQRRIVAIRFVRAETTIRGVFSARFHFRRQPNALKVPVVIAQVADRRQVLARRERAFIINHRARGSRIAG